MSKIFPLRRSRMVRTRAATALAAAGALVMSGGLVMLSAPAASAHTPTHGANCEGVWVKGTNYESKDTNTLEVTVGKTSQEKTFSVTDTLTVAVPQDGEVHEWTASVKTTNSNASYTKSWSGTVGPCGEEKKVVVCKYVGGPPGTPHHVIVVARSAIDNNWNGSSFPWTFGDAHDSVAIRYAVGNEQPGDEELVNCPERRTAKTPAGITTDDPCGPDNVTWAAKADDYFTYSESNGIVTATLKDPGKYVATGTTSWALAQYEKNETCPPPPCPDAEQPALARVAISSASTPPAGCYEQKRAERDSCENGHEVRTWTLFREWTLVNGQWVLEPAGAGTISNDTGWVRTGPAEGLDCRGVVTPAAPAVEQAVCTGPGQSSEAVITPATTAGVTYVVDELGLVTATAGAGKKFAADLPDGWTRVSDTVATYQVDLTDPGDCLLGAEVVIPQFQDPDCDTEAAVIDAEDTTFMDFTYDATDVAPGETVVVTAVPLPGYYFPEGFVAEWSHTFDEVDEPCVLGSESTRPKPDKKPTVLGTQAGVPTAVAAGAPGQAAASPTAGLLAQLMVAGGLLLLLAGGWLGFGRREHGAHQA